MKKAWTGYAIGLISALVMAFTQTGCMQLTGAKKITLGTWSIESNAGFEVSAGAMQYDGADNKKTMNRNAKEDRY